jgi:hypothetical protein
LFGSHARQGRDGGDANLRLVSTLIVVVIIGIVVDVVVVVIIGIAD